MTIAPARTSVTLACLVGIAWSTAASADGGDTPGSGPLITQAEIVAGITLTGETVLNTNARDSGSIPLTDCRNDSGRDQWYTLSITSTIAIDIDLCGGTNFDAKIYLVDATDTIVYCRDNAREFGCWLAPRVSNLVLTPGLYELAIDGVTGYAQPGGTYAAEISLFDPNSCILDPACNGEPEGEPCEVGVPDTTNAGCGSTPPTFGWIDLNYGSNTICGTNWASGGQADLDWYGFTSTIDTDFWLTLRSEVDSIAFIVNIPENGPCPISGIVPGCVAYSTHCGSNWFPADTAYVEAGHHAVVVMPATLNGQPLLDGFPCPAPPRSNAYELRLEYTFPIENFCALAGYDPNHDNIVDFADILFIIQNWGPCPTANSADTVGASSALAFDMRDTGATRPASKQEREHTPYATGTSPALDSRTSPVRYARRRNDRTSPATAGAGDAPGTGPVITGAAILAGPVPIAGNTTDNTDLFDVGPLTNPVTDCGASTAPDAWYTIDIDAATGPIAIDVDLCETSTGGGGTLYDSKIFILDATNTPLQCNDETGCLDPGAGPSTILNLQLDPGTYELAIDGFGTSAGVYEGEVRLFMPNMCFLDPPCAGPAEGEPCDDTGPDNFNGGCNSTPEAFTVAALNQKVCGTNWGDNGSRDTDWWSFNVTQLNAYRLEVRAETDTVVFVAQMSPGGVCPVIGIPAGSVAFSGDCDSVHTTSESNNYILDPGDYIMFVGTGNPDGSGVFDGFPCPDGTKTNNAYEVEIGNVPLPPPPCPPDLNDNNTVDFADILVILNNWGPCTSPPWPCIQMP